MVSGPVTIAARGKSVYVTADDARLMSTTYLSEVKQLFSKTLPDCDEDGIVLHACGDEIYVHVTH